MVQLLIDKGVWVTAAMGDRWTALRAAVAGGHKEIAQLLIDNGALVDATCQVLRGVGWRMSLPCCLRCSARLYPPLTTTLKHCFC